MTHKSEHPASAKNFHAIDAYDAFSCRSPVFKANFVHSIGKRNIPGGNSVGHYSFKRTAVVMFWLGKLHDRPQQFPSCYRGHNRRATTRPGANSDGNTKIFRSSPVNYENKIKHHTRQTANSREHSLLPIPDSVQQRRQSNLSTLMFLGYFLLRNTGQRAHLDWSADVRSWSTRNSSCRSSTVSIQFWFSPTEWPKWRRRYFDLVLLLVIFSIRFLKKKKRNSKLAWQTRVWYAEKAKSLTYQSLPFIFTF